MTLLAEDARPRRSPLRAVFNARRWIVRAGAPWRLLPTTFPPWPPVYQQTRRGVEAGCFAALVHDRRLLVRLAAGRAGPPAAASRDARVRLSSPERGARAGDDGHQRRTGATGQAAVETLGQLLALTAPPAHADERPQVAARAAPLPAGTGAHVELAGVDQGATGEEVALRAAAHGIHLEVVQLPEAQRGVVLLPRRGVVARRFAWSARFRRRAREYERLPTGLAGLHFLAFACLLLHRVIPLISSP